MFYLASSPLLHASKNAPLDTSFFLLFFIGDNAALVVVTILSDTGKVLISLISRPLVDVTALVAAVKVVGLVNDQPVGLVRLAGNT